MRFLRRGRTLFLWVTPAAALIALGCMDGREGTTGGVHPAATNVPAASSLTDPPSVVASGLPLYLARNEKDAAAFAGDAACKECHADVYKTHAVSNHTKSLRVVTDRDYGGFFKIVQSVRDPQTDTVYHPSAQGGKFAILADGPAGRTPVEARFALGSGRNGQTYVGRNPAGQWYVPRLSYYTPLKGWDFTPEQEPSIVRGDDPEGVSLTPQNVQDCLSCHASTLVSDENGPNPILSHFGVGCESCHGPGKSHVSYMNGEIPADANVGKMEKLGGASQARLQEICAGCHSTLTGSAPVSPAHPEKVARFASSALERSACFIKSQKLTCITCHNPHTNVSHDLKAYEAACLTCHTEGTGNREQGTGNRANRPTPNHPITQSPNHLSSPTTDHLRICPVNPRTGCISCHLPEQSHPSFPHITFHNHWIRVWKK